MLAEVWRLRENARVTRYIERLHRAFSSVEEADAISAILLVEWSARPRLLRAAEWVIWSFLRPFGREQHVTVGPLQVRTSSPQFEVQAFVAAGLLRRGLGRRWWTEPAIRIAATYHGTHVASTARWAAVYETAMRAA